MENEISSELIKAGLCTRLIGQNIIYRPITTSTMDVARDEVKKGALEGTVIIAGEQTAGRGRLKRRWIMPADGAVALSVILSPDIQTLPRLIMIASLAVVRSIGKTTGLTAQIKWPNDVLLEGKKVSGILIENTFSGGAITSVIGIGINVNLRMEEYPEIAQTATSLYAAPGEKVSKPDLIRALLVEMESLYVRARNGDSVFSEWRDSLVTLGRQVMVTSPQGKITGFAETVNPDGSLMLRKPDGKIEKIVADDVTLREQS